MCFDLIACAVFFLLARTGAALVGAAFAPVQVPLIQLMVSGAAATSVRGLRMPAALKRLGRVGGAPALSAGPRVERETVNQYIERTIKQSCYCESQLWIMEVVVDRILARCTIDDFLHEVRNYLEGHDGPDAAADVRWIDKLIRSSESDSRKAASACGRMLARNGFRYLERVIARPPDHADVPLDAAPDDLPGRHPGAGATSVVPRPDSAALLSDAHTQGIREDEP